ncbi:hypothetical protein DFP72DRAFT_905661 [Ephemerocybe angulata]|uniref:Ubiquitin-like domain-containing protein n=1 Tax=Ephemerocybe angulata TaxID=980116 RepID=A0A8H6M3Z3_9AGAR|nr:hypothetical protein DFP72DRAFT_905661 [Tulosesus angulatus]
MPPGLDVNERQSHRLGRRAEPYTPRMAPTHRPSEAVTYPTVPPALPSKPTPFVAPTTQPPLDLTLFDAQAGPRFFCGSSNNTFSSVAITTVQGNMIKHGIDYDELRRAIAAEIRSSIPAMVRHSNKSALVLTDALGETLTIPWSFVPTYEELKRLLVNHFRGKLGEQRVQEGRYCIGRAEGPDDKLVVNAGDWVRIRDESEQLVMSMLIEQELDRELHRMCPKCGRTELGTYVDQGWHVWCVFSP